jgi:hypothetical protein
MVVLGVHSHWLNGIEVHELNRVFSFSIFAFYFVFVQHDIFYSNFSGIDVGDQFYSRAEMVVLGVHSHWLNGIDYMRLKYQGKVLSRHFSKNSIIVLKKKCRF